MAESAIKRQRSSRGAIYPMSRPVPGSAPSFPVGGGPYLTIGQGGSGASGGTTRLRRGAQPEPKVEEFPAHRTAGLAHDASNLLAALDLYSELLAAPGVLAPRFRHYAEDLRRVGETGARLIAALARPEMGQAAGPWTADGEECIDDLGAELLRLRGLLQSLAGPAVRVEVECMRCAGRLGLNAEELLRIVLNLVTNAFEAMQLRGEKRTGRPVTTGKTRRVIRITAQQGGGASFLDRSLSQSGTSVASGATVLLTVRDNGPGFSPEDAGRLFTPGFSTRGDPAGGGRDRGARRAGEAAKVRGLGLAIVRQLVENAGGAVRAVSAPGRGARFDIELPLLAETAETTGCEEQEGHSEIFPEISCFQNRERGVLC